MGGDGNCDDANNNCGCGYDGDDCCAKSVKGGVVKKSYCKQCKCIDPRNKGKVDPNCKGACVDAKYQGDGNCDDANNNCGCGYDGGDCCKQTVKGGTVKTSYCKLCKCIDPNYKKPSGNSKCKDNSKCGAPKYEGDGVCDDNNNNCGCRYDGGDCCPKTVKGGKTNTNYCKQCKCLDPKGQ